MQRLAILLLFLAAHTTGISQTPAFKWGQQWGANNVPSHRAFSMDLKVTRAGHILTMGDYFGLVDFDAGPSIATLSGSGNYLKKTDTAGNHLWVKELGRGTLQKMDVDTAGNIYITGFFDGTIDIDPGPGVYNLTSVTGSADAFLYKLDPAGNLLWGFALGGANSDWGRGVCVDRQGNVYITGYFNGNTDMDPGTGVTNLFALFDDPFIAKYTTNGTLVWAKHISGFGYDQGRSIAVDTMGNVFVTGMFQGTADFDPGPSTYNLVNPSTSTRNAFLLKLDGSGNFVWATHFGSNGEETGEHLDIDKNGNVVLSGFFTSNMDCDPGPGTFTLAPTYFYDYFCMKLTGAGGFIWAKKFGLSATGHNNIYPPIRHALDTAGNVYLTGNFKDTADFDPGPGIKMLTTVFDLNNTNYGIFMLYLDSSGNYRWADEFENGGQHNWGLGIGLDGGQNVYATGGFNDTIDFDPGPGLHYLYSTGPFGSLEPSGYLVKYGQCFPSGSTITATACGEYTVNGQTYSQSGTFTQYFSNSIGCDSSLTINLTINTVDTTVLQNVNTLTAQATGATYTWIDCSTMTPIPGATQQQFNFPSNGSYAVIVTKNGCTDTSACRSVVVTGIDDLGQQLPMLSIAPNPARTQLVVKGRNMISATVYDIKGSLIMSITLDHLDEVVLPVSTLAQGEYLLKVIDGKGQIYREKFLRQ